MCLIAFAWRAHSEYPLILVANRDEFFARPTTPAHWWPERALVAGRDEQAGGTWLGLSASGRFAALTNFRQGGQGSQGQSAPDARSRGALVTDYLDGPPAANFAGTLAATADGYAGFNLIYADLGAPQGRNELHYFSNRADGHGPLAAGVHGLSNAALGDAWPKVSYATHALRAAIGADTLSSPDLLAVLDQREPAADELLPDTGIGLERERVLSAPFIVNPVYGTRCTTVVLVDRNGRVDFAERSFDASGAAGSDCRYQWQLGSATPWRQVAAGAST